MYQLSDYQFDLPEALIARHPEKTRTDSRLLHLERKTGALHHSHFTDIKGLLNQGDLLVVNNTSVIPARLIGHKASGGKVEVLILDYREGMAAKNASGDFSCRCLLKASKRVKPGTLISFGDGFSAVVEHFDQGIYRLRFLTEGDFDAQLEAYGKMPLPPYIKRDADAFDKKTYQTVYAKNRGAVAAPTAGLHFTDALMQTLREKGVEIAELTLHVGYGTFEPVRVDDIRDHAIHTEWYEVPQETADAVNKAKAEGRRVVAVGTTSVRTLEFATAEDGTLAPDAGPCNIFIYPGYQFKCVDAMVTNFHTPESTLLMLVSAFAGRDTIFRAYEEAVKQKYRFFSYGDAMFID
ncbi:tRNA preQ1(34) S-adenosylmethionine ribosyltransferase-isomerase QueA [Desulfoluna sp.]|uniref:tRNA preQ1(34) S-adenosylmethionine ribosyltransferase-isomerase QueA n=1 Tax=Desulfoluna sp. TaxID=2045199 RepID=UPI002635C204|nr:tRNA preQ1(34) S-adenosylmethionine ribosyltransferase-isomerase QueA [Desulfoluna sp.]